MPTINLLSCFAFFFVAIPGGEGVQGCAEGVAAAVEAATAEVRLQKKRGGRGHEGAGGRNGSRPQSVSA